jgi:hypothetical protein
MAKAANAIPACSMLRLFHPTILRAHRSMTGMAIAGRARTGGFTMHGATDALLAHLPPDASGSPPRRPDRLCGFALYLSAVVDA